jgi:hypothetical protein
MKRFSNLFFSVFINGATTLGAYKLLFDTNGYFSITKNLNNNRN